MTQFWIMSHKRKLAGRLLEKNSSLWEEIGPFLCCWMLPDLHTVSGWGQVPREHSKGERRVKDKADDIALHANQS